MLSSPLQTRGLEFHEEVGRGARNVVYRASLRGREVAVKIPHRYEAGRSEVEYRREASLQARIPGHALPRIYEFGVDNELPYLLTEFIPGQTLARRLQSGSLDGQQTLRLAVDLARSLEAIHSCGLIHRDIKPANIMITPQGQARLIDFGLAGRSHLHAHDTFTGTFRYMAPEQLGMLDLPVDARSDLYSLGIVLFECLTGEPPFQAEQAAELFREHALAPVPKLPDGCSPPGRLQKCIETLLQKDPQDRFEDAGSVLLYLGELPEIPRVVQPLAGRESEWRQLEHFSQQACQGRGQWVTLSGAPGLGKSRLLDCLAQGLGQSSPVLQVRLNCLPDLGPFEGLSLLLDGLAQQLEKAPESLRHAVFGTLKQHLGRRLRLLEKFTPRLAPWLDVEDPNLPLEQSPRHQSLVVCKFLEVLARVRPLALLIDDIQRLDTASTQLLERFAESIEGLPCLVVATLSGKFTGVHQQHILELSPLEPESIQEILEEHLGGPLDATLLKPLLDFSGGNPWLALQTLESALEEGLIVPHWAHWREEGKGLAGLRLSQDHQARLSHRLEHLRDQQTEVLQTAAILGQRFQRTTLLRLWPETDPRDLHRLLTEAQRLKILNRESQEGFHFVHESLREALLGQLKDEQRREFHRRAALALEPGDIFGRAEQFWRGLTPGQVDALTSQANLEAGRLALESHAPVEAWNYFWRVSQSSPPLSSPDPHWPAPYADACFLTGRLSQALELYHQALDRETRPERRADLWRKLGQIHLMELKGDETMEAVQQGLNELGLRLCAGPATRVFWLLAQALRGRRQRNLGHNQHPWLATRLYLLAAYNCLMEIRPTQLCELLLRGLQITRPLGPSSGLINFTGLYGVALTAAGFREHGRYHLERAREMAVHLNDPAEKARCQVLQAMATRLAGQEEQAATMSARCLTQNGRWLSTDDFLSGCLDLTHNLHLRGHIQEAVGWAEKAAQRLESESRQPTILSVTLQAVYSAVGRSVPGQSQLLPDTQQATTELQAHLVSRCHALLEVGELGQEFEQNLSRARHSLKHPILAPFHVRCLYLIEGYARYRQQRPDLLGALLRQLRWVRSHPLYGTHYLVLRAGLARLENQPVQCRRFLFQAQEIAEQHHNLWALLEIARMKSQLCQAEGRESSARFHAQEALSLATRAGWVRQIQRLNLEFDLSATISRGSTAASGESLSQSASLVRLQRTLSGILQLSVTCARVLEPKTLYGLVLGELLQLLGAERAFLFLAEDHGLRFETGLDSKGQVTSEEPGHSQSLVQQVMQSRTSVLLRGDEGLNPTQSLETYSIRSVMATPLLLGKRLLGVLYLDSRLARGVFGRDDLQVAEALAGQVAVALETARAAHLEVQVRTEREQRLLAEELGIAVGGILRHLNTESILEALLEGLAKVVPYQSGRIVQRSEQSPTLQVEHGQETLWEELLPSEQPMLRDQGLTLSAPLRAHARNLGWVELRRNQSPAFHQGDLELASTLISYASLALENAGLFADVERLATTDELTRMSNRRHFFTLAQAEWQRAERLGHPLCLIMFDVDHFKKFNDTYGHAVGDLVLRVVADRCRNCFRAIDIQGRLGGEEFAVILVGTALEAGLLTAERFRRSIADEPFPSDQGPLRVHISLGVAQPTTGETLEEVLERADQALYRAKAAGRNQVQACSQAEGNSPNIPEP